MALVAVTALAQTPSPAADQNLYSVALKASIIQMENEYGPINDSVPGESVRTDYRHMTVKKRPVDYRSAPDCL